MITTPKSQRRKKVPPSPSSGMPSRRGGTPARGTLPTEGDRLALGRRLPVERWRRGASSIGCPQVVPELSTPSKSPPDRAIAICLYSQLTRGHSRAAGFQLPRDRPLLAPCWRPCSFNVVITENHIIPPLFHSEPLELSRIIYIYLSVTQGYSCPTWRAQSDGPDRLINRSFARPRPTPKPPANHVGR